MDDTHEEGLEALHNQYHAYMMRLRGKREALPYEEWLEHTAVRLADKLGAAAEEIDELQEQRDRYKSAASINHGCWVDAIRQNQSLWGILGAVRAAAMRGDLPEVCRLLMVWACWN
jgi:hypothetical protein